MESVNVVKSDHRSFDKFDHGIQQMHRIPESESREKAAMTGCLFSRK